MTNRILTKGELYDFIVMWGDDLPSLQKFLGMTDKEFKIWVNGLRA